MAHLILLVLLVSTYAYAAPQPAATDTGAAARLNDQLDFDFHNVFPAIFKASVCTQNTYRYSPEYDHAWGPTAGVPWQIISDTMFGLGNNWRPTDNRIDAHLRIYYDDGARYKHSANGQLWDTVEHFYRPAGDGGVHACQEQTFHRCYPAGFLPRLEQMPLQTLFHKWMHAMPFLGQDYPDARGMSGSWDHVITLFTEQALHDPEAYSEFFYPSYTRLFLWQRQQKKAYLGLWAALADLSPSGYLDANGRGGGYTIDRFWGIWPEETKWDQNFLEDNTGETDNPAFGGWITA
ncbi:hypothetical protein QC762_301177 [Podospora pseudocomata]|uniref:Uncharacterized protein n=1 Tax=Podospora pseudocomata TaxID=2093779 RepID=A0ABR0GHR1_9PEZI|nr:hypothetical protein QC762_301177 [Podospora pseudocomata]